MKDLFVVILAGGSGTRLWPLSRQLAPKQLLKLTCDLTLLQDTIARVEGLVPPARMAFITAAHLLHEVKKQSYEYLGEKAAACRYVGEPVGRNTAPAILLGTLLASREDPGALVLALPSDHVVADREAFRHALEKAASSARKGNLVTFGIVPDRPETGFGYIKAGKKTGDTFLVERFEEKPPLDRAEQFLSESGYYWNSGMFLFLAAAMMEEARLRLPDLTALLETVDLEGLGNLAEVYEKIQGVSLDYGLMEKTDRAAVVPASMGWSDVGSWDALYEIGEKDGDANLVSGNVLSLGSRGSLLMGSRRLVAAVGLTDHIVVDSEDAVLVVPRGRSQEVAKVVARLAGQGRREHIEHPTVRRPWGLYTVIEEGRGYKVKKIVVDPGHKLSLQMHRHRSEHWVVISGTATVTRGKETFQIRTNESTFIPVGARHRLENAEKAPLEIIEVQNGEVVSEDDIVRFEDKYDRK